MVQATEPDGGIYDGANKGDFQALDSATKWMPAIFPELSKPGERTNQLAGMHLASLSDVHREKSRRLGAVVPPLRRRNQEMEPVGSHYPTTAQEQLSGHWPPPAGDT